eukprot:g2001.t1
MGNSVYHLLVEGIPRIAFLLPELRRHATVKVHVHPTDEGVPEQAVPPLTRGALGFFGIGAERIVTGHIEADEVFVPNEVLCGMPGFGAGLWLLNAARAALVEQLPVRVAERLSKPVGDAAVQAAVKPTAFDVLLLHRARGRASGMMPNAQALRKSIAHVFGVSEVPRATLQNALSPPPAEARGARRTLPWRVLEFSDADSELLGCYECIVALFRRARIIIGRHGAGFAHMMAAAPRTAVIEVCDGLDPRSFMDLSYTLGLEYRRLPSDGGLAPIKAIEGALTEIKEHAERAVPDN